MDSPRRMCGIRVPRVPEEDASNERRSEASAALHLSRSVSSFSGCVLGWEVLGRANVCYPPTRPSVDNFILSIGGPCCGSHPPRGRALPVKRMLRAYKNKHRCFASRGMMRQMRGQGKCASYVPCRLSLAAPTLLPGWQARHCTVVGGGGQRGHGRSRQGHE